MIIPKQIQELVNLRNKARSAGNYAQSDLLREQIAAAGYILEDTTDGSILIPPKTVTHFLTVFGSGETSSIGRKIHEFVLEKIDGKEITIGIISTPAGFQPNVVSVHEEIQNFFTEHLANFRPRVKIIYANTNKDANNKEIVSQIEDCNYLFMGPGSPTYAVTVLKNSYLYDRILEKVAQGVSLSLSSAAALAFSQHCLPVYEIYKVGTPLHWVEGLDAYQQIVGEQLTIIPHLNNNEGGTKNDTSYCFMGEKRFSKLSSLLPAHSAMLGIDEQTAKIWNLRTRNEIIIGKGRVVPLGL